MYYSITTQSPTEQKYQTIHWEQQMGHSSSVSEIHENELWTCNGLSFQLTRILYYHIINSRGETQQTYNNILWWRYLYSRTKHYWLGDSDTQRALFSITFFPICFILHRPTVRDQWVNTWDSETTKSVLFLIKIRIFFGLKWLTTHLALSVST
jgi:hypothetical protein